MQRSEFEEVLRRALSCSQDDVAHARLLDFNLNSLDGNLGFMGDHNVLHVTYEINDRQYTRTFFYKRVPCSERHSNYIITEGVFAKEKEIYQKIIPMFCKYLNVPKLLFIPNCYFIKDNEFMILDNLTDLGYKLHDKLIPLDIYHCESALKALAKFHAASFITESKTGKSMEEFCDYNHEVLLVNSLSKSIARSWHLSSMETLFRMLQRSGEYEERLGKNWDQVHEKISLAWDKGIQLVEGPSEKFRNVLCHRDLWSNNILFKYNDEGKPAGAMLIDFQLYRYCPPVVDIVMLLYLTTTRELREKQIYKLLQVYHAEMSFTLKEAGVNPEGPDGLQLNEILASFEEFHFFGICIACRYLPTCLRSNVDMELVKKRILEISTQEKLEAHVVPEHYLDERAELLLRGMKTCPEFRSRVCVAVDQFLDWLQF
ncbi:hypothetical protein B566_EDAN016365 [Ephemera danica]|nr:hypothetical protein B566_EDAN016365 [Ephemera danica]